MPQLTGAEEGQSSKNASRLTEPRHDELLIGVSARVARTRPEVQRYACIPMQVHQFTTIKGITTELYGRQQTLHRHPAQV